MIESRTSSTFINLLTYVVLGPFVGLLAMVCFQGVHSIQDPAVLNAAVTMVVVFSPFAFMVGWIPALLAGLVALAWDARLPTRSTGWRLSRDVIGGPPLVAA